MTRFKKVKYVIVFTSVTSLFVSMFKRSDTSNEPITKQCVTTVHNAKLFDSIKYDIYSPDTNYSTVMNIIENQYTGETLLESASYDTLQTSQKKNASYRISTKPYIIKGQKYYPMATADGFTETGSASWYGPRFHGKKTASGDIYDQNKHTAAHKTLPFGTRVKVENLDPDNHTYTIVIINDRGPFADDRIIDLSYAAAKKLGLIQQGVGRVRLTVIKDEEPTITSAQKIDKIAALKDTIDSTKLRVISDSVQKFK